MPGWELFDQVAEVVRGSAPTDLGDLHLRVHHNGLKAWFGDPAPAREHYEAQLVTADIVTADIVTADIVTADIVTADIVTDAHAGALEIGFHAEHRAEADNEAVLTRLLGVRERWQGDLGDEAVAGPFLGRSSWRRVSEVWLDPELEGADVAFEVGVRLVEYMRALEPLRRVAAEV
ncbi:hypothetical protein [Actinomadura hibisca]|uniref:hypothetical protein n=1 Tax=Actinomadura hibisca TaxID=68565 RepID=UPI0008333739|nr:hypothetical protein [Actinomadura hibisca]